MIEHFKKGYILKFLGVSLMVKKLKKKLVLL